MSYHVIKGVNVRLSDKLQGHKQDNNTRYFTRKATGYIRMSDVCSPIPIVDLDRIGVHRNPNEVHIAALQTVSSSLKTTFCQYGVCYFKNHGIDDAFMDNYMTVAKSFFEQPVEMKCQYVRGPTTDFGYTPMEKEVVNFKRPADLKEAFTYQPGDDPGDMADKKFQQSLNEMFAHCTVLGCRLLDALSLALGKHQLFLREAHKLIGTKNNPTTLKTLMYPQMSPEKNIKPNQVRLGEHSDFGTMTLMFQDEVGGLDVFFPGKGYIPATPIPGTILLIAANLLQRWTSDSIVSVQHRILQTEDPAKQTKARQSAVYFIVPDFDSVITPIDGSKRYEPITCREYVMPKLEDTLSEKN
ncbi:uncharacterized protein LOC132760271 isoform X1 [Ruditapes philippinarum]|uniref:uncharacterized protein LOC132760271 isoform X1 n=2 Tax=Ruditapes philippinarum TaxID=129788 RepID=UPI00295B112E|nr:uncharacterized protein LOC132760271 isoform X1 [Ruditapes philippinarum]